MKAISLALLLTLLAVAGFVRADGQALGVVRMAVENRSTQLRQEAIREGLQRVLVRLTGERDPLNLSGVAAIADRPERWLEQYGYSSTPEGLLLEVHFDAAVLNRSLLGAGVPVWAEPRTPLLLWLVSPDGRLLAANDDDPLVESIRHAANQRGLPVILPEMDDQDLALVLPADVRGFFDDPVRVGSARYGVSWLATVVIYPGSTRLRWRVLAMDTNEPVIEGELQVADSVVNGSAFDEDDLLAEANRRDASSQALAVALVHELVGHLSSHYQVMPADEGVHALRIEGIADLLALEKIRNHISGLSGVEGLWITELEGGRIDLRVNFVGDRQSLGRLAALQENLDVCPASEQTAPSPDDDFSTISVTLPVEGAPSLEDTPLRLCWVMPS